MPRKRAKPDRTKDCRTLRAGEVIRFGRSKVPYVLTKTWAALCGPNTLFVAYPQK